MLSKTMLHKTMLPFLPVFLTTFLGHVYHCGAHLCHVICYTLPVSTLSYILRHRIDNSGMKKKKKGELFGGVKSSVEQRRPCYTIVK